MKSRFSFVTTVLVTLALVGTTCSSSGAADWKPAAGPLMTQWAKDVSPEKALPEYPRPQMVRTDWQNLNGLWDYSITGKAQAAPAEYQGKILVPFPVESALSGVMKPVKPDNRLWYHRTFEVPKTWAGKRVLIHFGAVDYEATVLVNGKELGTHKGGYDAFSFDITDALKNRGPQELVVSVLDPTDGANPHGKQTLNRSTWSYTPTTGIWQTPWLEPVPRGYVKVLRIVPDLDKGAVRLTVETAGASEGLEVRATMTSVSRGDELPKFRPISAKGRPGQEILIDIDQKYLWSPEEPWLYNLCVELRRNRKTADSVKSYFGLRKISLGKDDKNITRLMFNNKFVMQVGTLDQGFWPDGIYTAPTDEALRYDIEMLKKMGFNMTRKHVKIEPDRWYYWADKLGLLVWQDMPSTGGASKDQEKQQFETELRRMIEDRGTHPCIVMWVLFNEGWGQYDIARLTEWVKMLDPSRLVNTDSGWTDFKVGDVVDVHCYPGPNSPVPEEKRAAVLGEFGGLGFGVKGHTWGSTTWGYEQFPDLDALTKRYVDLLRGVWRFKASPGLSAAVYTQTTDCETECNGVMTYDRVPKMDLKQVAPANRGEFSP